MCKREEEWKEREAVTCAREKRQERKELFSVEERGCERREKVCEREMSEERCCEREK